MKNFLIILICVSLIGCAFISDYYVSQPMDIGKNYEFWPGSGTVVLNLEDVTLYLQSKNSVNVADGEMLVLPTPMMKQGKEITKNYRNGTYLFKENLSDVVEGDYFYVEILIKAERDGFFFNPKEVYLELEDGKYLQASRYLIPNTELGSPYKVGMYTLLRTSDYSWRTEKNEQDTSKYFRIKPEEYVGFAIRFEIPTPNPGTPFNIEIKGLKRFEEILLVPKIRYKDKKIYRDYRSS